MQETKRYNPNIHDGLSSIEIEERKKEGLVNFDTTVPTKSIKAIIAGNVFTIFNLLNLILGVAVFFTGSYKNLLFLVIITCNTIISTYQELHSKRVIDKLAVISATKTTVIRDGKEEKIGINEIVLDDIVKFKTGNQVITDCVICDGEVEVNESFITGESDSVYKKNGDTLLSGSFIVSGSCIAKVEHIAGDNYTAKIGHDAKQIKMAKSEIMIALNKIIKTVSFFILPIGLLLLYNQVKVMGASIDHAVLQTVAALVGMIPEGLILLTSTVLAVSSIRLSRSKVLIQELYCIEALARVDTLCLDKTGTITEGRMEVKEIIPEEYDKEKIGNVLNEFASSIDDTNPTMDAIRQKYSMKSNWKTISIVPFSSQRKWSGVTFENEGSYILGAPEFVLGEKYEQYNELLRECSKECRVLVLAHSINNFEDKQLQKELKVCGFILLQDVIRKEAGDTLKYFKEQGVEIKIISGDNPITVSNIAKRAGVECFDKFIDMSTAKLDDIKNIASNYTIFGRVSPTQKQELIKAIKENGHTVAMTGDGVNDVLALKEADCSIAIATGSDAARNVSQLVLLNSNFSSMPKIVAEGRRTINNIERSSELFLTKTIYASILAVLFAIITMPYPFKPIQFSLINVVTIGIPSFVLALQPNKARVKGKFLKNILSRAFPTSLTVVCNIILAALFSCWFGYDDLTYATYCVILTTLTGFTLLVKLCRPFNLLRCALLVFVVALFLSQIFLLSDIFYIVMFNKQQILILIALIAMSEALYLLFNYFLKRLGRVITFQKIKKERSKR
ncbi:MAG: HAD-IC family P-type ATPase [Clostridia bacterium]|nr:HAD-IC family P-type ATPase [Clostridia bacterium]